MKKLILLLMFLLASPCWGDAVAHWKMNDNAVSTTVVDSMGNHNGDFNDATGDPNTSAHTIAGKIDTTLDFDGTDDYIEVADHNDFSFGDGSTDSPFSISAWVYMDDISRFTIVCKWSLTGREWMFRTGSTITAGRFYFQCYDHEVACVDIQAYTTTAFSTGQWYHVVATYNASGVHTGLSIYVNGQKQAVTSTVNGIYVAMKNLTMPVLIGTNIDIGYANGKIDNVMIFNTALSADEVKRLYNNGNGTENLADLNQVTRNPRRSVTSPLPTRSRYEF